MYYLFEGGIPMSTGNEMSSQEEIAKRFMKVTTTVLSDVMDKLGIRCVMDSGIRPLCPGLKIAGPARTIKRIKTPQNITEEDYQEYAGLTYHETVDSAKAGEVIVISAEKETEAAGWGGNMSTRAKVIKLAGVVLDCSTRDSQEIVEMGFPVFSRGIFPKAALGILTTVGINVPAVCGGILVHPGDMIVGDNDGVVVVPKDRAEEILKTAEETEEIEQKSMEYIAEGHPMVEAIKKYKVR